MAVLTQPYVAEGPRLWWQRSVSRAWTRDNSNVSDTSHCERFCYVTKKTPKTSSDLALFVAAHLELML